MPKKKNKPQKVKNDLLSGDGIDQRLLLFIINLLLLFAFLTTCVYCIVLKELEVKTKYVFKLMNE